MCTGLHAYGEKYDTLLEIEYPATFLRKII